MTIEDGKITDVEGIANPGHATGGCGSAVTNIMALKPDALVVSGIGGSPAQGFANAGLEVYFDKESDTVETSIARFLKGQLQAIGNKGTCSTH